MVDEWNGEPKWVKYANKRLQEKAGVAERNLKKKVEEFTEGDIKELITGLMEFMARKKKQWYGEYFAIQGISGRKYRYLREHFKILDEAIELVETGLEAYWISMPFKKPALAKHCAELRAMALGEGALVLNWKGQETQAVGIQVNSIFGGVEAKPIISIIDCDADMKLEHSPDKQNVYLMEPELDRPPGSELGMDVNVYKKEPDPPQDNFFSEKSRVESGSSALSNSVSNNNFKDPPVNIFFDKKSSPFVPLSDSKKDYNPQQDIFFPEKSNGPEQNNSSSVELGSKKDYIVPDENNFSPGNPIPSEWGESGDLCWYPKEVFGNASNEEAGNANKQSESKDSKVKKKSGRPRLTDIERLDRVVKERQYNTEYQRKRRAEKREARNEHGNKSDE